MFGVGIVCYFMDDFFGVGIGQKKVDGKKVFFRQEDNVLFVGVDFWGDIYVAVVFGIDQFLFYQMVGSCCGIKCGIKMMFEFVYLKFR